MISNIMMKLLMVEYAVIAIVCLFEKDFPRALYWISAGLITLSILWGMK